LQKLPLHRRAKPNERLAAVMLTTRAEALSERREAEKAADDWFHLVRGRNFPELDLFLADGNQVRDCVRRRESLGK
jgi:hypothetical protein